MFQAFEGARTSGKSEKNSTIGAPPNFPESQVYHGMLILSIRVFQLAPLNLFSDPFAGETYRLTNKQFPES